jgi:hypothetical protein
MQKCDYEYLPNDILEKIECQLNGKKLVYASAIDSLGNDITLVREGYNFQKLSMPIYTSKFIVDSLSFCSFMENSEVSLDVLSFEQIDSLLNTSHKFILVFDSEGGVTSFNRPGEESCDFPPDVKFKSIAFGVFQGSCCYWKKLSGGGHTLVCVSGTTCPCPTGWICQ